MHSFSAYTLFIHLAPCLGIILLFLAGSAASVFRMIGINVIQEGLD